MFSETIVVYDSKPLYTLYIPTCVSLLMGVYTFFTSYGFYHRDRMETRELLEKYKVLNRRVNRLTEEFQELKAMKQMKETVRKTMEANSETNSEDNKDEVLSTCDSVPELLPNNTTHQQIKMIDDILKELYDENETDNDKNNISFQIAEDLLVQTPEPCVMNEDYQDYHFVRVNYLRDTN